MFAVRSSSSVSHFYTSFIVGNNAENVKNHNMLLKELFYVNNVDH